MKTQYYTASSLDGFIADRRNGIDWLMQFGDDMTSDYPDFIKDVGALIMGSTTYEWMLENHVGENAPERMPWPYAQTTWVLTSRTLPTVPGADIRFVRGDVTPIHAEMVAAAKGKNVWIVGGGDVVGQFHDAGLLDEIIVTIASVTLGGGAPLLPREIVKPPLTLTSATMFNEAFVQLRYDVRRAALG